MTNDEILASYLDRTLSEDGLLDLEARQANSPEFANHVREMVALEDVLTSSSPRVNAPAGFLQSVEDQIAARIVSNSSATSSLTSAILPWIGGSLATLIVVGGIYLGIRTTEPAQPVQQTIQTPIPAAPSDPKQEIRINSTSVPVSINPEATIRQGTNTNRIDEPRADASRETSKSKTQMNSDQQDLYKSLEQDFDADLGAQRYSPAIQIGLHLGEHYRTQRDLAKSTRILEQSLDAARRINVTDFIVKSLGELAKTSIAANNTERAKQLLNEAITLGTKAGTNITELKNLRSQMP